MQVKALKESNSDHSLTVRAGISHEYLVRLLCLKQPMYLFVSFSRKKEEEEEFHIIKALVTSEKNMDFFSALHKSMASHLLSVLRTIRHG